MTELNKNLNMQKEKQHSTSGGEQPEPQNEQCPKEVTRMRRDGTESVFHYLKTVNTVEELDKLRFEFSCNIDAIKRHPNFASAILLCVQRRARRNCQFCLLVLRPVPNGPLHVYTTSEHNHPVKPAEQRSYRQKQDVVPDGNPPATYDMGNGLEWAFRKTMENIGELNKFRIEQKCINEAKSKNWTRRLYRRRQNNNRCAFRILALKTTKGRFHVYQRDDHTCGDRTVCNKKWRQGQRKIGSKEGMAEDDEENAEEGGQQIQPKRRRVYPSWYRKERRMEEETDKEEEEEGMQPNEGEEEAETEMEVAYPVEKCQRRLESALRKGRAGKVRKWMGRVEAGDIGGMVAQMELDNVRKMVEMGTEEIGGTAGDEEDRLQFWLPWFKRAIKKRGPELAQQNFLVVINLLQLPLPPKLAGRIGKIVAWHTENEAGKAAKEGGGGGDRGDEANNGNSGNGDGQNGKKKMPKKISIQITID